MRGKSRKGKRKRRWRKNEIKKRKKTQKRRWGRWRIRSRKNKQTPYIYYSSVFQQNIITGFVSNLYRGSTVQGRTGQERARQGRIGQDRAGQSRVWQGRADKATKDKFSKKNLDVDLIWHYASHIGRVSEICLGEERKTK